MIPPLLDELLRAVAPTGFEEETAAIVRREAGAFAEVSGDVLGSTVAVVRGTAGGRLLAIVAHCDEVGAMVSHVDETGLLSLQKLGDWSAKTLVDRHIVIRTRDRHVPGVVGTHVSDGDPAWADLYVDVGARDRDESLALVALGDPAVLVAPPVELAGGRFASRACDNRISVYAGLEALRSLAADPPPWDVALVATVQEEGSYAGARTALFRLAPDAAVVLDATWATDLPGGRPEEYGAHSLGGGPAILRGPAVHPALFERLLERAREGGMPHSVEVAAKSLTDADAVVVSGGGIATCIVSTPMRRYHAPSETVDLADVERTRMLVEAFARSLEATLDLTR